jgi:hypothetical protein
LEMAGHLPSALTPWPWIRVEKPGTFRKGGAGLLPYLVPLLPNAGILWVAASEPDDFGALAT